MTARAAQLLLVAVILAACAGGSGTAGQEERLASPEEQAEAQLILNTLRQVTIDSYLSPPGAGRLYAYTLTAADESRQEGGSAAVAADRVLRTMLEGNPTAHTALAGYAERRRAADPAAAANADLTADRLLQLAAGDGADELTGTVTPDSVETREYRSVDIPTLRDELGIPPQGLMFQSDLLQQLESDGLLEKILASDGLFSWETTPVLFAKETPQWGELLPLGVERETLETCDLPIPDRTRVLDEAFALNVEYDLVDSASPSVSIWLGGRGTITPAGMWVEMAADAAAARDADILAASAAVARATHNATIVNYREKYRHNLVRPETLWDRLLRTSQPLVRDTPPHPSYPSGHSAISAAGAHTISTLFGEDTPLTLRVPGTLGWPDQTVSFDTPAAALADVSESRIVAGFHYPLDIAAGEKLGHCAAAVTAVEVR